MNNLSILYPPITHTYAPAFVRDGECRVYFSISPYNTFNSGDIEKDDIGSAQVTLVNQNTNLSALKYPNEIKICPIIIDTERSSDDKYYITLNSKDLINSEEGFLINQYYKVQIRFTSSLIQIPKNNLDNIDKWLDDNKEYFSEWSRVTLIRGISKPNLYLKGFNEIAEDENSSTVFSSENIDLIGKLTFDNNKESETLKSYRVQLLDSNKQIITDSGDIYANIYNNVNEINYTFNYKFIDGQKYIIKFTYTTKNLYSETKLFRITVVQYNINRLRAEIIATPDNENGRIKINVKGFTSNTFSGNITIRRSSSKTNFTIWEDVYTTPIIGEPLNLVWYDMTPESGVWYRYCAQKRNGLGGRGIIIQIPQPVMITSSHIYLYDGERQLKIKYNPGISSLKHNIIESKTDTIGGKYPIIRRNGNINYKTFPITGLITAISDKNDMCYSSQTENNLFTSKEECYQDAKSYYDKYEQKYQINQFNDIIYEKAFRDKVIDFLYKNNVKLFKSLTEGNILVKLMDINLTPQNNLGRQIYSFSCTAYEIDECSILNYDKYNIQKIGTYSKIIKYGYSILGQIHQQFSTPKVEEKQNITDVIYLLKNRYEKKIVNGESKLTNLSYVRIEFEDNPYLILDTGTEIRPLTNEDNQSDLLEKAILGYIVYINNKPLIINPEGICEFNDVNTAVTSITFPIPTNANIDFIAQIEEQEDLQKVAKTISFYHTIGQCWGTFSYKDSIYQQILDKYEERYSSFYKILSAIEGISIEAEPGTVIYLKDLKDNDLSRHIIKDTCVLEVYDEDTIIEGIYFGGFHLDEATEYEKQRINLPNNKFAYIDEQIIYDDVSEIQNPKLNGVYNISRKNTRNLLLDLNINSSSDYLFANKISQINQEVNQFIYYQNKWYPFSADHDIIKPVEGAVNYYGEIMKGEF